MEEEREEEGNVMESCRGEGRTSWTCGRGAGEGCGVDRGRGWGWGGAGGRLRVKAAVGGYHDTKRGGTDVAFDFTDMLNGIRLHHVRVFVSR